jgi:spore coat polysaccharide biosynthesis predicted glycosyltransferase SpsG
MFVLDSYHPDKVSLIHDEFAVECVSPDNWQPSDDLSFVLKLLKRKPQIHTVIVDHYQLDLSWQQRLKQAINKLVVIDDLNRQHSCDLVIDYKWVSSDQTAYAELQADKLLGPEYALLSPDYLAGEKLRHQRENQILLSLGGGGDMTMLAQLAESLLSKTALHHTQLVLVCGPVAINQHSLAELQKRHHQRIQIIDRPVSLADYFRRCRLFVGALGTSLYELAATQTPALTFSIAPNQENSQLNLQPLGHFFHLNHDEYESTEQLADLAACLFFNWSRLNALRQHAPVLVDGMGTQRVARAIMQRERKVPAAKDTPCHHYHSVLNKQADILYQQQDYRIRAATDADVNHYLQARNRENNAGRMTVNQPIPRTEHYLWWFNQSRQNYVLEQQHKPLLYIWHQLKQGEKAQYLYGGWFTTQAELPFQLAMLGLKWQLDYCKTQHPQAIWLAVIHKHNKFVGLLNKTMGFATTAEHSTLFHQTRRLFPKASPAEFNFVHLNYGDQA